MRRCGLLMFAAAALPPTEAQQIPGPPGAIPTYTPLQPRFPPSWRLNESTVIMPCDTAGWFNASFGAGFGIADYDWSNAKQVWSKQKPMDCQERLLRQAEMTKAVNPQGKVWVYRNLVKALPWFTDVREKMSDPAYSGWFLRFKPKGPYHVSTEGSPYYHDKEQTPQGDCGGQPCGEYLWDHRNQSLRAFLIDTVIGGPSAMGSPAVDGLFLDDFWSNFPFTLPWSNGDCATAASGGPSEVHGKCIEDMGLSDEDVQQIAGNWSITLHAAFRAAVDAGGYVWQMLQFPDGSGGMDVNQPRPASFFRSACAANSTVQQEPTIMQWTQARQLPLPYAEADVAAFLLVRGPYAWLGYSWLGCDRKYDRPAILDRDFGVPVDARCRETAPGVFQREWSKATVTLNTTSNEATFAMKN